MSLYNMLFGQNPLSSMLLEALGATRDDVPRYRDCYLAGDDGKKRIVIHTRTGGGNRDAYEAENEGLRELPGFLYDEDDDFDCTYADFYYEIPEAFKPIIETLTSIGAGNDPAPAEKWRTLIKDLEAGAKTEEASRALAVGQKILAAILPPPEATP